MIKKILFTFVLVFFSASAYAATSIPFTINMSEAVNVTGTPRIAVDVGGVTRYATYASGTGTSVLTFTYDMVAGDVDLDGVTLSSPIDFNGGTVTDLNGNPETNLTFTAPNTSGIKIDYPSLSMDFIADADGRYTLNGTAYNDLPSFLSAAGGTYTRNSVGTYFDENGVLQTASSNTPRFDHDPVTHAAKGILIEESRTNYVVNSEFNGAAVSGGVITGMSWSASNSGINTEITAVGTLNGEKYIEFHIYGTNSSGAQYYPSISLTFPQPSASMGQNWTASMNVLNISGTGANLYHQIAELNSSGDYLISTDSIITNAGRTSITRTLSNASTAKVRFILLGSMPNGSSIDRVIRFSVPQFELGAFPTSYIPTTNAAVTRAADNLTMPTGGWFNASEGTAYTMFTTPHTDSNHAPFSFTDGSIANRMHIYASSALSFNINNGGIFQAINGVYGSLTHGQSMKANIAYKENDFGATYNGSLPLFDSSGTIPNLNQLAIGRLTSAGYLSSTIQKFKYYPARIPDTQLQLLTQ